MAGLALGTCLLLSSAGAQAPLDAAPENGSALPAPQSESPATGRAPHVTPGDSPVGNAERLSLRILSLSLDMHLNADTGAVTTRARLRVRNGGPSALPRVALQVSSALLWESASLVDAAGDHQAVALEQYRMTTDTDHTGAANELVLPLAKPLVPGAELNLDLYYGGTLTGSAERLARLGAPAERAAEADWDGVSSSFVGLRGFGNVLWYPVSAPAALLADGESFPKAVNAERERTAATLLSLSLSVEHTGPALTSAWFLDRAAILQSPLRHRDGTVPHPSQEGALATSGNEALKGEGTPTGSTPATQDDADAVPEPSVIDTAQWDAVPTNGRPVSLFVAGGAGELQEEGAGSSPGHIRVVGVEVSVRQRYVDAAARVQPLLQQWLPARVASPLLVVPLPSPGAQAFADGDLLVTPVRPSDTAALAEALVYPLAAAALPGNAPAWVRQGLPEFLRLLYLEQTSGRDRMLAELGGSTAALQTAESARGMDPLPLRTCVDPVCARSKAAYALVMLRGIVGDAVLQHALLTMLTPADGGAPDAAEPGRAMTRHFEDAVTQGSGKDMQWFFADWFSADRGLPDLQIVQVAPRRIERGATTVTEPTRRGPRLGPLGTEPQAEPDDPRRSSPTAASRNTAGLPDGSWLVAVEVQNNGDAAAEVPVTVRSAGLQNQMPLRVPAHGRATVRVPFETTPEDVWVNDGTTPEQHGLTHHRAIEVTPAQR